MTEADTEADTAPPRDESKLFIGQHGPSVWRENMQIGNPMSEGLSACGLSPLACTTRLTGYSLVPLKSPTSR
jgi:hypothetical protein